MRSEGIHIPSKVGISDRWLGVITSCLLMMTVSITEDRLACLLDYGTSAD